MHRSQLLDSWFELDCFASEACRAQGHKDFVGYASIRCEVTSSELRYRRREDFMSDEASNADEEQ